MAAFIGVSIPSTISLDDAGVTVELWVTTAAPATPAKLPIVISQYDSMF